MTEPRCLSKEEAARYVSCSVSGFNDWVSRGIMPRPLPGTRKWDRKAIDAALDRLSGLQTTLAPGQSAFDRWKAGKNASAGQGDS